MRYSIAVVAACAASVQAFRDTSPFLLFSSAAFPPSLSALTKEPQLQPASHILSQTQSFLHTCPTERIYIIAQPLLSSTDITPDTFPTLQQHLLSSSVASKLLVSEVQGLSSRTAEQLIEAIKLGCGEKNTFVIDAENAVLTTDYVPERRRVRVLDFGTGGGLSLDPARRERELRDNDARIDNVLRHAGSDYTVIYTSTPVNATIGRKPEEGEARYTAEFVEAAHMDLKRDIEAREPDKTEVTDFRPLFEKYQFLTPGLFMGLLVGLIMISILGVGLNAISSLQVSYGAFDKEMGPAAQKKQQ